MYGWVQSEGGGGWEGPEFLDPPLSPSKNLGPLLQNFKFIGGILSSSPVDWHPF